MPDSRDKINQRLEKLREFVEILVFLKGVTRQELETNIEKRAKAERFLQLAIEVCIDIAELIISEAKMRTPESASDAIRLLGEGKILDREFAQEFSKSVGMRNILIHDYTEIDYEKIADAINNKLGDFEVFGQSVAKYLTSKN